MDWYIEKLKTKNRENWSLFDQLYFQFGYMPLTKFKKNVLHVYGTEMWDEPQFAAKDYNLDGVVYHS